MRAKLLWRRPWLWLGSLALLPAAVGLAWHAWSDVGEPFDPRVETWLRGRMTDLYGPSRMDQVWEVCGKETGPGANPFMPGGFSTSVADYSPMMDAPVARERVQAFAASVSGWMDSWERATANGGVWEMPSGGRSQPRTINFLELQQAAKTSQAIALSDAGAGRMAQAIANARRVARVGDPVQSNYMIGELIATACRGIAAGTYTTLLNYPATAEESTTIIKDLQDLRDHPVVLKPETLLNEWSLAWRALPRQANLPKAVQLVPALNAVLREGIVPEGDPDCQYLRGMFPREHGESDSLRLLGAGLYLPWTRPPLIDRKLRSISERHPEVLDQSLVPASVLGPVPPGKRLFQCFPGDPLGNANYAESSRRASVAQTRIELAQAAWAARAYHAKNGHWPRGLSDLASEGWQPVPAPPSLPEGASLKRILDAQGGLGPFSMGMIRTDSPGFGSFLQRALSYRSLSGKHLPPTAKGNTRWRLECDFDSARVDADDAAYLASSVANRVPASRRSIRLLYSPDRKNPRREVEAKEALALWEEAQATPGPGRPSLELEMEIEFPAEVLAIWSPFDESGKPLKDPTGPFPLQGDETEPWVVGNVVFPGGLLRQEE